MHHPLLFVLTFSTLSHGLIIFATSSSIENVAISCGSSDAPTAPHGRVWVGDNTISSTSSLHLTGKSWASRAQQKASPVPYQTARASQHEFSYRFSVKPGQKFIRLHFNPAPYNGFKKSLDLFTVKAGPYTLLTNFSPSLTADSLGAKFVSKEYCVNVQESQALTITFIPSREAKASEDVYAFVNGIEIVSMPTGLYFTPEGDLGAHVVGQNHRFYIDTTTAMQMIQRLNVGGQSIPSIEDVSMFRGWKDDKSYLFNGVGAASIDSTITIEYADMLTHVAPPKVYQTARSLNPGKQQLIVHNLTWIIPVNLGFRYLVRLHFCEFEPGISAIGERQFSILINNQIAEYNADVIKWSGASGIAVYRDYIAMMEGDKMKGTGNLVISLQPNSELSSKRTEGILNGLEIFKLSNPDNCLAGMNPAPHSTQSSVSEMPRRQRQISFDRKSAIATAFTLAITLLNIAIYYLRLTTKSDVYGFGVVLLEVLTGRPALDRRLVERHHNLATWAIDSMRKGEVNDIVDCSLAGQISQTCLKVLAEIAEKCLERQPHERPDMADVLTKLEIVLALQQTDGVQNEAMSIDEHGALSEENLVKTTADRATKVKGKDLKKKDSNSKRKSVGWKDLLLRLAKTIAKDEGSPNTAVKDRSFCCSKIGEGC
nr:receptor-like protein kinase FERONIA [Ipomoea batatas]